MARLKRKSVVLEKTDKRVAGMEAISPALDLGNGLTVPTFIAKAASTRAKLDAYNQLLSLADAAENDLVSFEKDLREFSERMLEAVGSVYGHDSNEYEKAGGKRKSERKRPVKKNKTE